MQNMTSVAALAGIPASTGTKVRERDATCACSEVVGCENGNAIFALPLKPLLAIVIVCLRA